MDRMIQRIQQKADELHTEASGLLQKLQDFGWKDTRPFKEPERQNESWTEIDFGPRTIPSRARVPQDFVHMYHKWYAAGLALVEANMPSRLKEFSMLHHAEAKGKTDGMHHLLSGEWIDFRAQTEIANRIVQMDAIVASLPQYLEGRLFDLELEVAHLYVNDQLDEAEALLKLNFVRAAGAIAGVLLERHLRLLCDRHYPAIRYPPKKVTIAILNDRLKDNSVYDVAQWRKVQWMGDVRNKCDHAGNEPDASEVADLVTEVRKFVALFVI